MDGFWRIPQQQKTDTRKHQAPRSPPTTYKPLSPPPPTATCKPLSPPHGFGWRPGAFAPAPLPRQSAASGPPRAVPRAHPPRCRSPPPWREGGCGFFPVKTHPKWRPSTQSRDQQQERHTQMSKLTHEDMDRNLVHVCWG